MLIFLIVVLNALQIHAWSLEVFNEQGFTGPGETFSGTDNRCQNLSPRTSGQVSSFKWNRGFFEDCCIHLKSSPDTTVGDSCPDWEKSSLINDNSITSFCVSNC